MQNPGLIDDYVKRLAGKLDFDRSLSLRVCQEVEDHLREAAATDATNDVAAAERRAVANFGDPDAIAGEFAVISLAKQSRRTSSASILGIGAIFIAMKGRVAWYALAQWTTNIDLRSIVAIVGSVDRYAFWFSVIAGIGCWLYISTRRFPGVFDSLFRRQLDRFLLVSTAMIAALTASVASDGILTAIALSGTGFSGSSLVPILSMAIEILCAGLLALHIRSTTRRVTQTAALWNA
jgi:cation transport ATPase